MRFSRVTPLFALLLCGCSWFGGASSPFTPEEVLQKAARASQDLQSANYTLEGTFGAQDSTSWNTAGNVRIEGTLSDGGNQNQMQLTVDGTVTQDSVEYTLDGTLEVIVTSDASYMKLHALTVQPSSGLFRPDLVGQFAGKWWVLPPEPGQTENAPGLGPDPRIMQAQAAVVTVTDDNGIVKLGEYDVYHYKVQVDPEKLVTYLSTLAEANGGIFDANAAALQYQNLNATGELWIDSTDFTLRRVQWEIAAFPVQGLGIWSTAFTVEFRNHNSANPVVLPTDTTELSPGAFLSIPPPALPDQVLPGVPPELEQQMLEELINPANP